MSNTIPTKMHKSIIRHSFSAAGIGVPGAFAAHADIVPLMGIWANMIYRVAKHADKDLDWDSALKVAASLGAAGGVVAFGAKAANTYFAFSGIGTPLAILFNASANGVATYYVGRVAAQTIMKDKLSPGDIFGAVAGGLGIVTSDVAAEKIDELLRIIRDTFKGPNP
jgi:hypothetical protein